MSGLSPRLILQPEDGIASLVRAIRHARKTIDIVIFRFDIDAIEVALADAVRRGVVVRALVSHTNRGGEKKLRQLEDRLLRHGVTLSRTADDMVRYHGKLLLVDRRRAFVLGFNFTHLDVERSRSFGLVTAQPAVVRDLLTLIEADHNRVPYVPTGDQVIVSPENARERLGRFIAEARKELLIYDPAVKDDRILALLTQRAEQGVDVRILGRLEKKWRGGALSARKLCDCRLHVRAIVRDRQAAFVGSQSLRKLELDNRREVGLITEHRPTVARMAATFEADWTAAEERPRGWTHAELDPVVGANVR